jgi:hypothetical protein
MAGRQNEFGWMWMEVDKTYWYHAPAGLELLKNMLVFIKCLIAYV